MIAHGQKNIGGGLPQMRRVLDAEGTVLSDQVAPIDDFTRLALAAGECRVLALDVVAASVTAAAC